MARQSRALLEAKKAYVRVLVEENHDITVQEANEKLRAVFKYALEPVATQRVIREVRMSLDLSDGGRKSKIQDPEYDHLVYYWSCRYGTHPHAEYTSCHAPEERNEYRDVSLLW